MASGRKIVTKAFSHPVDLRPRSLSLRFNARHYQYTPWLLLQEEGHDKAPYSSLEAFAYSLRILQRPRRTFLLPPSFRSFHTHTCGFFSTFARATYSLSVSSQYLGLEFNAPVFTQRTKAVLLDYRKYRNDYAYEAVTLFGRSFQSVLLVVTVCSCTTSPSFCKEGFGLPCATFTRCY
jgi:hypothetical protein